MNETLNQKSILEMASGAIKERADYEMKRILDNILDINTAPTKKRTLTLTVDVVPDSERTQLNISVTAKSKLEPTNPVSTALYITGDQNGEVCAVEMVPQIPGQINILGAEQERPAMLRLLTKDA
ncbi:MAG: hypothetical protein RR234_06980 [Christensenella sp.]